MPSSISCDIAGWWRCWVVSCSWCRLYSLPPYPGVASGTSARSGRLGTPVAPVICRCSHRCSSSWAWRSWRSVLGTQVFLGFGQDGRGRRGRSHAAGDRQPCTRRPARCRLTAHAVLRHPRRARPDSRLRAPKVSCPAGEGVAALGGSAARRWLADDAGVQRPERASVYSDPERCGVDGGRLPALIGQIGADRAIRGC